MLNLSKKLSPLPILVVAIITSSPFSVGAQGVFQNMQLRSAAVDAAGTILDGSSWISSVSPGSTGVYKITFSSPFSASPNCLVTADSNSSRDPAEFIATTVFDPNNLASVTVRMFRHAPGLLGALPTITPSAGAFRLICMPDQRSFNLFSFVLSNGAAQSGTEWISNIQHGRTGQYAITPANGVFQAGATGQNKMCFAQTEVTSTESGPGYAEATISPSGNGIAVTTYNLAVDPVNQSTVTMVPADRAFKLHCEGFR